MKHSKELATMSEEKLLKAAKKLEAYVTQNPSQADFGKLLKSLIKGGAKRLEQVWPTLNQEQKSILKSLLSKAKKTLSEASPAPEKKRDGVGRELEPEKADAEDETLVKPELKEIKHQGDDSELEGEIVKSETDSEEDEEDKVEKAEGARGGKIVGHTRSGKPIYESADHSSHQDFSRDEKNEAAKVHMAHQASNHNKVIGLTRSGKNIHNKAAHPNHAEFTHSDHADALSAHSRMQGANPIGSEAAGHHNNQSLEHAKAILSQSKQIPVKKSDFAKLEHKIEGEGKPPESAAAITATIGREKLGEAEMERRSEEGREKAQKADAPAPAPAPNPSTGAADTGPKLDPQATKDFTAGFNGATGFGKSEDDAASEEAKDGESAESDNQQEIADGKPSAAAAPGKEPKMDAKEKNPNLPSDQETEIAKSTIAQMLRRKVSKAECMNFLKSVGYDDDCAKAIVDDQPEEEKDAQAGMKEVVGAGAMKTAEDEKDSSEKPQEPKIEKSVKWKRARTQLDAGGYGRNCSVSTVDAIEKAEAVRAQVKKTKWNNEGAIVRKADANKIDWNLAIEQGLDRSADQVRDAVVANQQAGKQGDFTVTSYSEEEFAKSLRLNPEKLEAFEKAEGARGGKIIGHTSSGKPIYASASHPDHASFTDYEHTQAAKHHHDRAGESLMAAKYFNRHNHTAPKAPGAMKRAQHHLDQAFSHENSSHQKSTGKNLSFAGYSADEELDKLGSNTPKPTPKTATADVAKKA